MVWHRLVSFLVSICRSGDSPRRRHLGAGIWNDGWEPARVDARGDRPVPMPHLFGDPHHVLPGAQGDRGERVAHLVRVAVADARRATADCLDRLREPRHWWER